MNAYIMTMIALPVVTLLIGAWALWDTHRSAKRIDEMEKRHDDP